MQDDYHWHIEIQPDVEGRRRFLGTEGFHFNPIPAEQAALVLRALDPGAEPATHTLNMDNPVNSDWKQVRLLVFDLDGTLVDSKQDLALSVNAMRAEMGLPPSPLDFIASYVGHGVNLLVRRSLGTQATDENVEKGLAFFLDYYRDHMLDHTAPYPGVSEALEKLGGHKMAVLTNKPVNFSREMLTRLGFAPYFAYIYGGNSFPQKKPDPIGLHKLMEDLADFRPRDAHGGRFGYRHPHRAECRRVDLRRHLRIRGTHAAKSFSGPGD